MGAVGIGPAAAESAGRGIVGAVAAGDRDSRPVSWQLEIARLVTEAARVAVDWVGAAGAAVARDLVVDPDARRARDRAVAAAECLCRRQSAGVQTAETE